MSGGGTENQTVQSKTELPPELRQAFADLSGIGKQLYSQGQGDQYTSTYVGPSAQTTQALNMLTQRAQQGQPLVNEAFGSVGEMLGGDPNGLLEKTASGSMVGANPYLDDMFQRGATQVQSQLASAANTRGLAGNAPAIESDVLAKNLTGLATDIYGRAYESDMNRALSANTQLDARRMGAVSALPGLSAYADQDIAKLMTAGAIGEDYQQRQLADKAAGVAYQQDRPWDNALRYAQILGLAAEPQAAQTQTSQTQNTPWFLRLMGISL